MRRLDLLTFAAVIGAYNVALSVVAWATGWPPQFGGSQDPDQSYLSYLLNGSAVSAPLPPLVALLLGGWLSQRGGGRWRILGLLVVAVIAVLFMIGVLGELIAEHRHVPFAVVAAFALVNILISLTLLANVALAWRVKAGTTV